MPGVKNLSVEPNGMAQIEADRFISLEEIKRVFEQTRYRVVNVAVNH
ncbi:MAG: hypothetical protein Q8P73_04265 [bacterium]|nr:hypothetical protein [bacterium]